MHLYSVEGKITKYNDIDSILQEYYEKRIEMYEERRKYQLSQLKYDLDMISNKVKFILMVVDEELIINKRKRTELEKELEENEFDKMGANENYDYLLSMPIYQLTHEKIEELKKQEKEKKQEHKSLNEMTAQDIWKHELIELKSFLETSTNKSNESDKQSIKKGKKK
jgi:DNA topoisomerase-2